MAVFYSFHHGFTANPRADPFARVLPRNGRTVADHVTLHNPRGRTSKQVYADIEANLESWVENAYRS